MELIRLLEYQELVAQPLPTQVAQALRGRCGRVLSVDRNFETPGTFDLTASDWVGQVVVGDVCVVIDPKTPVDNLFYMLTYAYRLPRFQREPFTFGVSEDLLELVVLIFARQVENLVRRGIYRSYIAREENLPILRGRLLMNEQLCRNPVQLHRFFTRRDEFTADVLENRLLKAVIFLLSRLTYRQPDLRRRLRRLLRAFDQVSHQSIARDDFDRVSYGRLNQHYASVHSLARLLWEHLSLESYEGEESFISYLLHMWRVFEVFTAEYLTEFFSDVPGIDVAVQQDLWLDTDERVKGVPDVVIKLDDRPALVLDTKYKDLRGQPPNQDFYQMVTYCLRLGLSRGILIYPGTARMRRTFNDILIDVLSLDLTGDLCEFQPRCRRFAEELHQAIEIGASADA
jgi:5-methylcytosine-specific restriction enzyme subunit McrC